MTLAAGEVRSSISPPEPPRAARFTRAEYLRMVERGAFNGLKRRVLLFRGELLQIASMGWEHWHGVQRSSVWAFGTLGKRFHVACQLPTDAPGDSVPEPDIAVYATSEIKRRPFPGRAELFIEVADSSLKLDREMAQEYAATAREYWILDVRQRVSHVYRNPHVDPNALFGMSFDPPVTFAPLCDPSAIVVVRDLLPPTI